MIEESIKFQHHNFTTELITTHHNQLCVAVRGPYDSLMTYNHTEGRVIFSTTSPTNVWYTVMYDIAKAVCGDADSAK